MDGDPEYTQAETETLYEHAQLKGKHEASETIVSDIERKRSAARERRRELKHMAALVASGLATCTAHRDVPKIAARSVEIALEIVRLVDGEQEPQSEKTEPATA